MAGHFTKPKIWKTHRFSKIRLVPGIHYFKIIRAYFKTSDQLSTLFAYLWIHPGLETGLWARLGHSLTGAARPAVQGTEPFRPRSDGVHLDTRVH